MNAGVAQLVERNLAKVEVESSSLFSRSRLKMEDVKSFHLDSRRVRLDAKYRHASAGFSDKFHAGVAQLVERNLAKVEVESSSLFSRSRLKGKPLKASLFILEKCNQAFSEKTRSKAACIRFGGYNIDHGGVAKWLCSGLQSRLRRFEPDPRLHKIKDLAHSA